MINKKDFFKITFEDIELAENFFENDKHLSEFLLNVIRYYRSKPTQFKTKIVRKYFETYKKTMDYIMASKKYGKKAHQQSIENEQVTINTLEGVLNHSCQQIVNSKYKIVNNKKKIVNSKEETNKFEIFWDMYDKKVGDKNKIALKFDKLSQTEINLIFEHVPKYIKSQPDKKFRKNPETYLNNKSWLDEVILPNQTKSNNTKGSINDNYF